MCKSDNWEVSELKWILDIISSFWSLFTGAILNIIFSVEMTLHDQNHLGTAHNYYDVAAMKIRISACF